MKKFILIMMAFMASFNAYAQEFVEEEIKDVEEFVEVTSDDNWPIINVVYLERNNIVSTPVSITAPLALTPDAIYRVSDSVTPSLPLSYWNIVNGIITITYRIGDLTELSMADEAYIYILTREGGYRIKLIFT